MSGRWNWGWRSRYESRWPRYVPVAERRAKAKRHMEKLVKKGEKLDPVVLEGRTIARTFWGKGWCHHLEAHCDFWNRLGRGRSYVRNGSVCDLVIGPGRVEARVVGNDLYSVEIDIKKLPPARWAAIRKSSTGGIASVIELLKGRLSAAVMSIMTHPTDGLFPRPKEIEMRCSCPDYAVMCKHVAAALYGVGARLDSRPELLFVLRGVDHMQLIDEAVEAGMLTNAAAGRADIEESELAKIFGVEIEARESGRRVEEARKKKAKTPLRPAEAEKKKKKIGKALSRPAGKPAGAGKRGRRAKGKIPPAARNMTGATREKGPKGAIGAKAKAKVKARGKKPRAPRGRMQ
jgi:uncharacterized Zn finger protein